MAHLAEKRICAANAGGSAAKNGLAPERRIEGCVSSLPHQPAIQDARQRRASRVIFAAHRAIQVSQRLSRLFSTMAMETHQTSLPAMKARVPSIGSTTNVRRAESRAAEIRRFLAEPAIVRTRGQQGLLR